MKKQEDILPLFDDTNIDSETGNENNILWTSIKEELDSIDINNIKPIDAIYLLDKLKSMIKSEPNK